MLTKLIDRFLDFLNEVVRPALVADVPPSRSAREDE